MSLINRKRKLKFKMTMDLETLAKRMMNRLKVSGTLTRQIIWNLNLKQTRKNLMKGVSATSISQLLYNNKLLFKKVRLKIKAS